MKTTIVFLLALVACFAVTDSTITRPDETFWNKVHELESSVERHMSLKMEDKSHYFFVIYYREVLGRVMKDYANNAVNVTKWTIASLGVSDTDVRTAIAAETPNACFTSLLNSLDTILEQSGYAISTCVELPNANSSKVAQEFIDFSDAEIAKTSDFPWIQFDAFIGRNFFTQPDEIIARLKELLEVQIAEAAIVQANAYSLLQKLIKIWYGNQMSDDVCFIDLEAAIKSSYEAVQGRFTMCRTFGSRGARSILPPLDIASFFSKFVKP